MDEFERGFMVGLILGESNFAESANNVPCLSIYNTDMTILEYCREILQKAVGSLGYKEIRIRVKKSKENLRRKKPVHLIGVSGRRVKKICELLPELKNFDTTKDWFEETNNWKPNPKGRQVRQKW